MTAFSVLSPLHLPSLALGRLPPSQACPWEGLGGRRPPPLAVALSHLWPVGRRAWVACRGPWVTGLIAAVRRTFSTWEVSGLCAEDGELAASLLRWAPRQLSLEGAERLLLRLPAEGELVMAAHRAGFLVLACEHLYVLTAAAACGPHPLAPLGPGHEHHMFRLYLSASPPSVRALQGPTLGHWQATLLPGRQARDLGLWEGGQLTAWLRLRPSPQGMLATAVLHPQAKERAQTVVEAAAALARGHPLFFLVPAHQQALASALEAAGGHLMGHYVSLVKPLAQAVPLTAQEAAPEPVRGRVPVS